MTRQNNKIYCDICGYIVEEKDNVVKEIMFHTYGVTKRRKKWWTRHRVFVMDHHRICWETANPEAMKMRGNPYL